MPAGTATSPLTITGAITTASMVSLGFDASLATLLVSLIWISVPAGIVTVAGATAKHVAANGTARTNGNARLGIKWDTLFRLLDEPAKTEVAPDAIIWL